MSSQLFGAKYEVVTEKIIDLFPAGLFVDVNVQRDLSKTRARQIAKYILKAVRSETVGAFFAPLVVSERVQGGRYIIDGQHRWNGILQAMEETQQEVQTTESALEKRTLAPEKRTELEHALTQLRLVLKGIENSQVPMMVYTGLTQKEERQLFHDLNNLARKAPLSLSLQYDSSDPYTLLAKESVDLVPGMSGLVEHSRGPNKVGPEKLFLFSTVYQAVRRFLGKRAFPSTLSLEEAYRENLEKTVEFLQIVVDSLPADKFSEKYLYRDAKVLQGIAEFARQMSELPRVDWAVTLKEILAGFRFEHRNHLFVTIGQAGKDQHGNIIFRGTGSGISAVTRTLASQARRLDTHGEEVDEAYTTELPEVDDAESDAQSSGILFPDTLLTVLERKDSGAIAARPVKKPRRKDKIVHDEDITRVFRDSQ